MFLYYDKNPISGRGGSGYYRLNDAGVELLIRLIVESFGCLKTDG